MQYLTVDEIPAYCTLQAGVEESDVQIASSLIDGYLGFSFTVNEANETVKVNHKHRGKLNYFPIIEVLQVKEVYRSPIGKSIKDVDINNLDVDIENNGYFTYYSQPNPFAIMFNFDDNSCIPLPHRQHILEVNYKYGYEEIPEDIKRVCAMLAQNIRQQNSFAGFKKLNTLDYTIEMANPSFFTQDMKLVLNKYKVI